MFTCVDRKRGKRGQRGLGKGTKNGTVSSEDGASKGEVPFFGQRSTIPSKRVFLLHLYTKHAINIVYEIAMFIAGHKIIISIRALTDR
jgi:hypothetical protein